MTGTLDRPMTQRPTRVHRENLLREAPFRSALAGVDDEDDDGQTIDGYGAVFDAITHISSWEGEFDEVISRGAFRKSIKERTPVMQYDHGRHPLIGSIPLGRWDTVEEDTQGLHVVGRLSDNWLIEPVRDAIRGPESKGGGITGMSFRFSIVTERWTDKDGKLIKDEELLDLLWYGAGERGPILRTLKELKVSEVGPVAWPAYETTSVGVRDAAAPFVVDLGQLDLRTAGARSRLAYAVSLADRCAPRGHDPRDPAPVPTPGGGAGGAVDTSGTMPAEPQATARAADVHPDGPDVTAAAAGEHSTSGENSPSPTRAAAKAALARLRTRRHHEAPLTVEGLA